MLIRCPTCASGYELGAHLLHGGRNLRCAHCRDAWVHRVGPEAADGPEIVAEAIASRWPAAPDDPVPARRPALRRRPALPRSPLTSRMPANSAAASLLAAALFAGGFAAVGAKARLVAAYPPSEAVFAALGLPVNLSGLAIGGVRSTLAEGDGPPTLALDGRITNLRAEPTTVPALRIAVRDKDGRELYHWITPAPKAQLAIGETVPFHGRLAAAPRDGQELAVAFAEAAPARRQVEGRTAEVMPGDR